MGRPRIYQSEAEKKAAYRQRLRRRIGSRAYRQSEAEKKATYRAGLLVKTKSSPSTKTDSAKRADTDRGKLEALCYAVASAREEFQKDLSPDWRPYSITSVYLVRLLDGIEDRLRGTKPRSHRLRGELAALLAQCRRVRKEMKIGYTRAEHIHNLELAYQCESIEDRLCELAGREKLEKPEYDGLSTMNISYPEFRERRRSGLSIALATRRQSPDV
jgi:hypothetical protein